MHVHIVYKFTLNYLSIKDSVSTVMRPLFPIPYCLCFHMYTDETTTVATIKNSLSIHFLIIRSTIVTLYNHNCKIIIILTVMAIKICPYGYHVQSNAEDNYNFQAS